MSTALIGYTGLVGGTLLRHASFDGRFNSKNIEEIRGAAFDHVICAGAPAVKWLANKEPDADRATIARLTGCLDAARIGRLTLISTIDVYPVPVDVDEDTPIDVTGHHAYGRHRRALEEFAVATAPTTIVRLPGLFGPGLKKNVIYDFLHGHQVEQIHADSVFQFYPLERLWRDLELIWREGLPLVNLATEPVSVRDVARHGFGFEFDHVTASAPARYDMRTRYSSRFGGPDGYVMDREAVLAALRAYVEAERGRTS